LGGSNRRVRLQLVLLDPKVKVRLSFEISTIHPSMQHQIKNTRTHRNKFGIYFLGRLLEKREVGLYVLTQRIFTYIEGVGKILISEFCVTLP
jgi:hypothetical protein